MFTFEYNQDNRSAAIVENGTEVTVVTCGQHVAAAFVRWLNCVNPQQPTDVQVGLWLMHFVRANSSLEG